MNYLSVCSGIEAASVAWHPLGWSPYAFSEIEKFPSQVLAHHYPDTPNLGDMTRYQEWPDAAISLLVGGTPCQSFSVAGLRKGLGDPRGNLMLTYGAIAGKYRPRWLVWENVPGVLSSNAGRDFGTFLGMLAELGYGFAYRILDAQYIRVDGFARAVPQRRRRVFVVGYLGDWRRAAAVLFERESLCGHPAPSRKAGEGIAGGAASRVVGSGVAGCLNSASGRAVPGNSVQDADQGFLQVVPPPLSLCLNAGAMGRLDAESETLIPTIGGGFDVAHTLKGEGFDASEDGTGRGTPLIPVTSFPWQIGGTMGIPISVGVCGTLVKNQTQAIHRATAVRRLTPTECERLQGFPDGWTDIHHGGKATPDGQRYKALGNSMAIPPMRWIGQRIAMVDAIQALQVAA
jgi:DNA (cytosine-5)-methyltransferase 1